MISSSSASLARFGFRPNAGELAFEPLDLLCGLLCHRLIGLARLRGGESQAVELGLELCFDGCALADRSGFRGSHAFGLGASSLELHRQLLLDLGANARQLGSKRFLGLSPHALGFDADPLRLFGLHLDFVQRIGNRQLGLGAHACELGVQGLAGLPLSRRARLGDCRLAHHLGLGLNASEIGRKRLAGLAFGGCTRFSNRGLTNGLGLSLELREIGRPPLLCINSGAIQCIDANAIQCRVEIEGVVWLERRQRWRAPRLRQSRQD